MESKLMEHKEKCREERVALLAEMFEKEDAREVLKREQGFLGIREYPGVIIYLSDRVRQLSEALAAFEASDSQHSLRGDL